MFIDPSALYFVEYRREASGIEIIDHHAVVREMPDAEAAGEALAEALVSVGGTGAPVIAAIRGFGVAYRLLTLPPADESVLKPIVEREMRRLHPEIDDPIVDFSVVGRVDRRTAPPAGDDTVRERRVAPDAVPPADILAASAPRHVVDVLSKALARHGLKLEHLTVPPQALTRLYAEVDGAPDASAVALLLPGGPLVGLFHGGTLRFVTEPPGAFGEMAAELQTVMDQVSRGRMYLRQQFRGADINRIFLATHPEEQEHFDAVLATTLNVDVFPLVPRVGPPGAVAALGAVLDAESESGLSFYPPAEVRRERVERQRRRWLSYISAAAGTLALAWAAFMVISARRAVTDVREARRATAGSLAGLETVRRVIDERYANFERLTAINSVAGGRRALANTLRAIAVTASDRIDLSRTLLVRGQTTWQGELSGTATGFSTSAQLRALDRFQKALPQAVPLQGLQVPDVEQTEDTELKFRITFETAPSPAATP